MDYLIMYFSLNKYIPKMIILIFVNPSKVQIKKMKDHPIKKICKIEQ